MSTAAFYESHCHTPLCNHATGLPIEYAQTALSRGLAGITFTCHGPTPNEWSHCMKTSQWPSYLELCETARREFAGRLDVRVGVECDYLPHLTDYWREFLGKQELSTVLGSVHPHTADYRKLFWTGDPVEYQKTYFEQLALAAESRLFDTLSHPDMVRITTPKEWNVSRLLPFIQRSLDRIAAAGVAMEINTSGRLKETPEFYPCDEILREISARQIPIVLGSDAHTPDRVADAFDDALDLLGACGFTQISCFVARRRRDVPLAKARASLKLRPAKIAEPA